ncbi:MAG: aspartate/glutamate racemase family protein [Rhodobacteraceae bacterium]|nr:aspartate/glutamate racemase family protein [Paracoccaceae bacterium]
MTTLHGGKSVYGASVGILMLDATFPRIPGDIGNALTWPFPVHYGVVRGASPDRVVRHQGAGLLDSFIAAAKDLVASGADGITTNCGFLALIQEELKAAVSVPVATSSLMQVSMVQALLPPGKRVGILTISQSTLTDDHLIAANVPLDTPIGGTDRNSAFTTGILDGHEAMDFEECRRDMLKAAADLVSHTPDLGAIVLECTNMVPYAADIRRATGLLVFSIYSFVGWFQSGLTPRRFPLELDDCRC